MNDFYYVIEKDTYIVRAAQSSIETARRYLTANDDRFIIGPVNADELHTLLPQTHETKSHTQ